MSRILQMSIFLGVILLVLVGSHIYFYFRLIRDPALQAPWRQISVMGLIILGVSVPATFLLSRLLDNHIAKAALFVPYCWIGMMLLLGFFLLCTEGLKLAGWLGLKIAGHDDLFRQTGFMILRNRIIAGGVLGISLVLMVIAVVNAAATPLIRKISVDLDRLPKIMDGFKIAQLTDLHLGPTLNKSFVEKVVDLTNREKPDLVVITGDLVDRSVKGLFSALDPFRDLEAEHGVFLVTGNHEFYAGVDQWIPEFEKLGIRVLSNQGVEIHRDTESFYLAGVHDPQGKRFGPEYAPDLERALTGRKPKQEVVLLAHQALIINEAEKMDVGLVLSGHSHGGQIWPWMHLVGLQQPYVSGLHRQGRTSIYVSQGTGFWGPPMRLGTSSEIAIITLKSKNKK